MLSGLVRFTRPHTIIATTIQVVSLFLIAGGSQVLSPTNLGPVLLTLITCLALNIYHRWAEPDHRCGNRPHQ